MKNILVPTDFSKVAIAAMQLAGNLARQFKSSVVLLHVLDGAGEGSFNVTGETSSASSWEDKLFNLKMIEKAKILLSEAVESLNRAGITAKSVLRLGNAYHGIQSAILEQKADLVVMGTEGSSGLDEILVGSNTEKVVRRSVCPVIAVNSEHTINSIRSIAWATSLRDEDLNLPPVLRELMDLDGTTVHLVRINTPGLFIPDTIAKAKLESFAQKMKLKRFTTNVYNDYSEEDGIIRFASSIKADLIALATHGRRGLAHLLNGSIAEDVINHSKRPVMTYVLGKPNKKSKKLKVSEVVI